MRNHALAGILIACAAGTAAAQVQNGPDQMAAFQLDKQALQAQPDLAAIPHSILVKFDERTPRQAVADALATASATPLRTFDLVPGLIHARTTGPVDQALAILAASPWIEYAEPDFVQRKTANPNDTYYNLEWGMHNTGQTIQGQVGIADADIDMAEAWDITTGDANKVIAVIDTGTQWSHPDLDGNIWSNPGEIAGNGQDDDGNGYVDDTRGWDFFSNDNNPDDTEGHGSHTAGTIGAEGNNGQGVAGVLWDCQIMPLRFLGPNGGSTSDAIAAINYAVAEGCTVSNNSWGGGGYSSSLFNAINNAAGIGHVFVAAAGNSGVNTDNSPHYPSSYNLANIISVAATDNRDGLASFSNYGANSVDLGAPGVNIASTYNGNGYVWSSGTSMAAPHVAGVVALVQSQNPGWNSGQVVNQILSTTRPISSLAGKSVTGGLLNAADALGGGGGGNTPPNVNISSPANNATFTEGDSVTFTGSASDTEDGNISADIVWTSNLDGQIGTGASFTTSALSIGTHTVTAAVSDSGGANADDTVNVNIDPPAGSAPNAPDGVTATNLTNRYARVDWNDNSNNETSFEIQRQKWQSKRNRWRSTTTFTGIAANSTSFTNRPGTGLFRYRVRATNASGDSAWSAWAEVNVTRR